MGCEEFWICPRILCKVIESDQGEQNGRELGCKQNIIAHRTRVLTIVSRRRPQIGHQGLCSRDGPPSLRRLGQHDPVALVVILAFHVHDVGVFLPDPHEDWVDPRVHSLLLHELRRFGAMLGVIVMVMVVVAVVVRPAASSAAPVVVASPL